MPRLRDEVAQSVYRCTESFCVFRAGLPEVYAAGSEVLEGDPILGSHRAHFEPVADRVRRARVEQTTAAPGELRPPVVPVSAPVFPGRSSATPSVKEPFNG